MCIFDPFCGGIPLLVNWGIRWSNGIHKQPVHNSASFVNRGFPTNERYFGSCLFEFLWNAVLNTGLVGSDNVMMSSWCHKMSLPLHSQKSVMSNDIFVFIVSESCDGDVSYTHYMWLLILLFLFFTLAIVLNFSNVNKKYQSTTSLWLQSCEEETPKQKQPPFLQWQWMQPSLQWHFPLQLAILVVTAALMDAPFPKQHCWPVGLLPGVGRRLLSCLAVNVREMSVKCWQNVVMSKIIKNCIVS